MVLRPLVLPASLTQWARTGTQASLLGIITFGGLLAGMLVQPVAGALGEAGLSDWVRPWCWFVWRFSELPFSSRPDGDLYGLQIATSMGQAAQQGLLPDLVPAEQRRLASGVIGLVARLARRRGGRRSNELSGRRQKR